MLELQIIKMKFKHYIVPLLILPFILESCYYDNAAALYQFAPADCDTTNITFNVSIFNILSTHCTTCHNAADPQGNVNLEGYDNIRNYVENGSLYGSVIYDPAYSAMPPTGQKIPDCDQQTLKIWIDAGAPNN